MTLTASALLRAAASSPDEVVELCRSVPEPERRAIAAEVITWFKERNTLVPWEADRGDTAAVLAVVTYDEFKKLKLLECATVYHPQVVAALVDRRPSWLAKWAEQALERRLRGGRFNPWAAIRRLVRRGLLDPPVTDAYPLLMISAIGGLAADHIQGEEQPRISDILWRDGLVEHEVWRLFEVEGRPRPGICLTSSGGSRWRGALLRLANDGRLDRRRLIDANLGALASGFSPYNNRWYLDLQRDLALEDDDRRVHARALVALLRQADAQVVKFGIAEARELTDLGAVTAGEIASAIRSTIAVMPNALAVEALALVDELRADLASTDAVGATAAAALAHRDTRVQAQALGILESLPALDVGTVDSIAAALPVASATLTGRMQALVSSGEITNPSDAPDRDDLVRRVDLVEPLWLRAAGVDTPHLSVEPDRLWLPLDPDGAIRPLQDSDEVVDLLTQLIEEADDADDVERVLGGLAQFGSSLQGPAGWGPGPLRKRANAIFGRAGQTRQALELVLATMIVELGQSSASTWTVSFPSRIRHVTEVVHTGRSEALMALPTHRGGFIHPVEFTERLCGAVGNQVAEIDACAALVRLVHFGRDDALQRLRDCGCGGPLVEATRYALGDDIQPPKGLHDALWAAADRSRNPDDNDELALRAMTTPPTPLGGERRGSYARWFATARPMRRESYYGMALRDRYFEIDDKDDLGLVAYLRPLLDPDEPIGPKAQALIVRALSAKAATLRLTALDITILAVEDGRLLGPELGDTVAECWEERLTAVPLRLAAGLGDVARASALHANAIRTALERVFRSEMSGRGAHAFLELLLEVTSRLGTGITDPVTRRILGAMPGNSKAAKAARAAAAVPIGPLPDNVTTQALAARVARAERYQDWARRWADHSPERIP